jgi:hypothetical protein
MPVRLSATTGRVVPAARTLGTGMTAPPPPGMVALKANKTARTTYLTIVWKSGAAAVEAINKAGVFSIGKFSEAGDDDSQTV